MRKLRRASPLPPVDLNPRSEPALDFAFDVPASVDEPDRLTPADWDELGFLCGLEVHQQLDTKRKLFCRCPPGRYTTRVDAEVLRHMRPTLSEMGQYDGCALMEFKTRKEIVYQIDRETACTYELDDTPPFEIDRAAVRAALEISCAFGLSPVSELHVMRKQYLDGSIPTGFQRTALIGYGGEIPFAESEFGSGSVLRIRQLTLEEDSCREVLDRGHRIVFRADRLGTPLIETVTEPDLRTPHDAMVGGALLARVARASGRVRRGAGAARQDVNVSIAGSRRVEIKGVPSLRLLPRLVRLEALRQLALLRIRAELQKRGLEEGLFAIDERREARDSSLVADVSSVIGSRLGSVAGDGAQNPVWALRLSGLRGVLARATQPGLTFAHELAERVRVIACPSTDHFLWHSDAPEELGDAAWRDVRAAVRADDADAVVLLRAPVEDLDTAVREVSDRVREAFVGVPAETRQAHADGRTGFERVLPGPDRMYPDTDTQPVRVPDEWLEEIELQPIETPWQREERYLRAGLDARAVRVLLDAPWAALYDRLAPRTTMAARRLAAALEKRLVHHWRASGRRTMPAPERLRPMVVALDKGELRPEACEFVLDRLLSFPDLDSREALAAFLPGVDDGARLVDRVQALRRSAEAARVRVERLEQWAMGRLMSEFRGKLRADEVRAAWRRAATTAERTAEETGGEVRA